MDRDALRGELARLIEKEAAADRFKDALADELHERDTELPEGARPDPIASLDEESRRIAEGISDYLESLEQLRHLHSVFEAVSSAYQSAGGQDTAEGRRLYKEIERLDKEIQETSRSTNQLEGEAQATLDHLAVLAKARAKVVSERGIPE
jgi:chromosome segregation ATPase